MSYEFEYPYAFLLILIYIICIFFCKKNAKEIYFSNALILNSIVQKQTNLNKIIELLFIIFLTISLSSIVKKEEKIIDNTLGYEIALSIDASESMREDNRFNITKIIVEKFIDKRENDTLALNLFAQNVYTAVPFTYDKKVLKDILRYIEIGVAGSVGTALNEALYLSSNLFKNSENKNKILILLTDGINTKDNIPLDVAIENAIKNSIKVYTIAIGKQGQYNKEALELIAQKTDGKFFETSKPTELINIYSQIDKLEKNKIETSKYTSIKYYYQYPLFVAFILLLFLLLRYFLDYGFYKKIYLIILSAILIFIAMFKPTINLKNTIKNYDGEFIIALDISKSMLAEDIKPNRLEFAKKKIDILLKDLKQQKVSLLAFSNQSYLISPLSNNYDVLRYLNKNITLDNINQNGTNFLSLLKSTKEILQNKNQKVLLIFTDGSNKTDFFEEIKYANENNINIFIYAITSKNGAPIKYNNELIKDENGNILITKLNKDIEILSKKTAGLYKEHSLKNSDLDEIINTISNKIDKDAQNNNTKNQLHLFYYFLILSFILFFIGRFDLKGLK